MSSHDVVVIGAGVAGMALALTASEAQLTVKLVEALSPGGEAMNAGLVERYPGADADIDAAEIASRVMGDMMDAGVEFVMGTAELVDPSNPGPLMVRTESETFSGTVLGLATGAVRPPLALPGTERFTGRGLSRCASCDGPLLAPGPVVVVGSGRVALWEAATIVNQGIPVALVAPRALLGHRLAQRLVEDAKITTYPDARIEAVGGDVKVQSVTLVTDEGGSVVVDASGVIVATEPMPNNGLADGVVPLATDGRVIVDAEMRTADDRIYAAGDVRHGSPGYLASAISDGITAGQAIIRAHAAADAESPQARR